MYVHERLADLWKVDLVAFTAGSQSTSVRDALLFTGYGAVEDSNQEETLPVRCLSAEDAKLIKNTGDWKENESVDVVISHVVDPDNVYVWKASNVPHLENLKSSMKTVYDNNNKFLVYSPRKGKIYI